MDRKVPMISSEAEKQRTPMNSPATPSNRFPIYLHFLTWGDDSHGAYYVIEEKGESPVPQYPRPPISDDVEYVPPILDLNQGEEDGVEDADECEEDNDDDPFLKFEVEAIARGDSVYAFRSFSVDGVFEEELLLHEQKKKKKKKKSKLEDEIERMRTENYSKKTKEGEIFAFHDSETDIIRPLQYPDLPFAPSESDMLLVGERFYLVGGHITPKADHNCEVNFRSCEHHFPLVADMLCWDSDVEKFWKLLPGPNIINSNTPIGPFKSAVWAAGTIFVMGHSLLKWRPTFRGLCSGDGYTAWKTFPGFPTIYMSNISNINSLAVNGSKIFFQVSGYVVKSDAKYRCHPAHLAAYFDVKSCQWEIVGSEFAGTWSPGVVLYDAYLLSYGSRQPSWKERYICVYSIQQQCWLRRPVRGLKKDGHVLPDDTEHCNALATYLFQVSDNVLAFVWSREPRFCLEEGKTVSEIHCTKFILHCIEDPRKKHPVFRAEVISYGYWVVEGYLLQNCFVRLNEMEMDAKVKAKHQSATA